MADVCAVSSSPTSGEPVTNGAPIGAKFTDPSVNVRVAMLSVENLPVPRMLVTTPRGDVAGFDSENSSPFSVPASHGYSCTSCDDNQLPLASSRDSPETPTNQSGLGATMVTSVTSGWSVVSVTARLFIPVGPMKSVSPLTTLRASGPAPVTSLLRTDVPPTSAIDSTPAVTASPLLRNVASALWTAPIRREKCAPLGTPSGVAAVVQSPWNSMV